jgi:hypothetical protein
MIKSQVTQEFGLSPMPTPDPARPACRVMVSLADFSFDEIPAIGTTLADSGLNITKKNVTWANHKFAGVADGPRGFIYFLFNPAITDPFVPFRSYSSAEMYDWPSVLKDLGVVSKMTLPVPDFVTIDPNFTLSFHNARYAFVQGRNLSTAVLVEEFISSEPFPAEFLAGEEPFPTPIDARYLDGRITFPECLHPEIEIPVVFSSSTSGYPEVYNFVDFVAGNNSLDLYTPYKVSKTNFLGWSDFTPSAETVITESNLYYAKKKTYLVPNIRLFSIS